MGKSIRHSEVVEVRWVPFGIRSPLGGIWGGVELAGSGSTACFKIKPGGP